MSIESIIDSLHSRVKEVRALQYFAVFNRMILAVSFIPSGMTKLLGYRFSELSLEHPAGYFFDAIYRTGGWYRFIGMMQVLAAILLLFPRTATMGAVLFAPIVLNIMLITIFVDFQGTWFITSCMFLANSFLVCWDYDKLKAILPFDPAEKKPFILRKYLLFIALGILGGIFAFSFFAGITSYFYQLGIWGAIGGAIFGGFIGYINARYLQKA